jgi:two-component system, chemotaxis family, protein-glutamate methylesterase/glutaminase
VSRYEIVVIGTSLGGLMALETVLGALPARFPVPVVVVQHRNKNSDSTLTGLLRRHTALKVYDAEDKMPLEPGAVYIGPPSYHTLVEDGYVALSCDAPVLYARPSIDVLFESAAEAYGRGTVGVIMTGASSDGAHGIAAIKRRGGVAIAQDPTTAEAPAMPAAAIAAAKVDFVLPLAAIGPNLAAICGDEVQRMGAS